MIPSERGQAATVLRLTSAVQLGLTAEHLRPLVAHVPHCKRVPRRLDSMNELTHPAIVRLALRSVDSRASHLIPRAIGRPRFLHWQLCTGTLQSQLTNPEASEHPHG